MYHDKTRSREASYSPLHPQRNATIIRTATRPASPSSIAESRRVKKERQDLPLLPSPADPIGSTLCIARCQFMFFFPQGGVVVIMGWA
jgi:hypothetical protein